MYRPEVWMSAVATPRARSAAVTRRTAWLACCSADATEAPLTWTPMLSVSWFGVPVTVPLPVTVIRPDLTAATSVAPAWPIGRGAAAPAGAHGERPDQQCGGIRAHGSRPDGRRNGNGHGTTPFGG